MRIEFTHPYAFEKKDYAGVDLPLEDMTGAELTRLKRDYVRLRNLRTSAETSQVMLLMDEGFAVYIAAQLSGQPQEFFEGLPVQDYVRVIAAIPAFFNGGGSAGSEA